MHPCPGGHPRTQPRRQGHLRPVADRHGQDRGLSPHHLPAPQGGAGEEGHDHRTHPRAGRPGGARGRTAGRTPRLPDRVHLRRGGVQEPGTAAQAGGQHHRRHPGPDPRPSPLGQARIQGYRHPGHRRGGPPLRHGLHSRSAEDAPCHAARTQEADHALFRHAELPGQGTRLAVHERPGRDRDRT
ncbi:MAG: hypothetical protein BWX71_02871 [Deltaproteobacteria bacterium ADurb.Bin072]|nr:MAG: hypothetical protein BWX71_02871 [Deltaproteobacteria bacterium ADurb.Bin072]